MNNITEIELSKLVHHPQNPRKDLGDLSLTPRLWRSEHMLAQKLADSFSDIQVPRISL